MKWIGVEYFCCNINICDNFEFLIFRNCRSEKDMSSITLYWCQSGVVGIHTDDCPFEGAHVSAVVDPGKFMNFNHDSVGRVYLVEENLNNNMQDSTPLPSSSGTSSSQVNSKKMYKEVILLTPLVSTKHLLKLLALICKAKMPYLLHSIWIINSCL